MKILLTGTTGQVGWELQRSLAPLGQVVAVGRSAIAPDQQLDLAQTDTIQRVVQAVRPDVIVNPAAYTAVDQAEQEPDLAMQINGKAPGILAEAAQQVGAALIHFSTDYVFNGSQATPYRETDPTDPQNVYGHTKLAGEQAIQAVGLPHLILRTSWVYGDRGKNFFLTMLKLGQQRQELRVVDDQIGAPTWSRAIAAATAQILAQLHQPAEWGDRSGLYHLTASGQTSWHGFATAIFAAVPAPERVLERVVAIPSRDYPTPAQRPPYSLLDNQKLAQTFGLQLPDWHDSLQLVAANYRI